MRWTYTWARYLLCGGLLLPLGCAASDEASAAHGITGGPPPVWGGQTGALMPACGLTPAARAGDSIPGGDTGIVVHPDQCVAFATAELELRGDDGTSVALDVEPLAGGAVLLRPRMPLRPGIYILRIGTVEMQAMVAEEPPALPMRLGTVQVLAPSCGAHLDLDLDPLVMPYLPQLKLSVSVDGQAERTWFDYGTLEAPGGRARLSLCNGQEACLTDGPHTLRMTAELAGELGTLEPIDVPVHSSCPQVSAASLAAPAADERDAADCTAAPGRKTAGLGALGLWAALGLLAVRRARRSSA